MLSGNLTKLYDDIKIPLVIRNKLEKMYRITTIDDLIESQDISDFANDSSDVLMLVYVVRYFNEIRKNEGKNVQLCPLINKSKQFLLFIAKFAVSKGIDDGKKHSIDKHRLQIDDELRKELEIDGNDTPWRLNSSQPLKYVELKKLPREIRLPVPLFRRLYSHQRSGIEWMANLFIAKTGGVLGDEMGMGKTFLSLSLIMSLLDSRTIRNAIVVCPNPILLTTWLSEATKVKDCFGSDCAIQVDVITSDIGEVERNKILKDAKNCSRKKPRLVITGYGMYSGGKLPRGFMPLKKRFGYIIIDEAHKLKNKDSNRRKNIQKVIGTTPHILLLTGTPLLNRLEELYHVVDLASRKRLSKWIDFSTRFVRPIVAARQRTATEYDLLRGARALKDLKAMIAPVCLIRKRNDHLSDIVPKNDELDCWCNLSEKQRDLYKSSIAYLDDLRNAGEKSGCVLPLILRLRMICAHPLLSDPVNIKEKCQELGLDQVINDSPKLKFIIDRVREYCNNGSRVIVFTHFLAFLDVLEFVFSDMEGINSCRLDGRVSGKPKQLKTMIDNFNSDGSMFNVMLVSIKAGGVGLTLNGASKCIVCDTTWSQAESDQAVARICRPGQLRECESLHLITAGTVEEKMFGKQIYKGLLERNVIGESVQKKRRSITELRFSNKEELTNLIELEPHGVCQYLESFNIPIVPSVQHPSIIAITRRSDVYNPIVINSVSDDDNDNDDNS